MEIGRCGPSSAAAGGRPRRGGARRAGLRGLGCVVAALVTLGAAASEPAPRDRFDTIVIDPGHGGEDRGARGATGLLEKELVLDVAERVAHRLRGQGLAVLLTRDDDTFVPLEIRTSVANDARADLFVSIHANSAPSAAPSGIETFFVSLESSDESAHRVATRENEAFGQTGPAHRSDDPLVALLGDMIVSEYVSESSEFSKLVQGELASVRGAGTRGVKQAPFVVLMGVQMPASLIEIGFLSNPDDERALAGRDHRDAIAEAITRAVVDFGKRYDARRGVGEVSRRE
jgi:N-acetylmuramoyl-L-alanine amidase